VKSVEDADHNITENEYDASGRITKTTNAAQGSVATVYDGNGNVTSRTPSLGGGETYEYDKDNIQKKRTDVLGKAHITAIDTANKKISTTVDGSSSRTVTRLLDERGLLKEVVDAFGKVEMSVRNDGMTLSMRAPGRSEVSVRPDALDRIVSNVGLTGTSIRTIDPQSGDVVSQQNPLSREVKSSRSVKTGELIRVSDNVSSGSSSGGSSGSSPVNSTVSTVTTRDENGNVTDFKDALGRRWHREFDGDDRMVRQVSPDGIETVTSHTAGGLVKDVTVAGKKSALTYNALNQVKKVTDPSGLETTTSYTEMGQVESRTAGGLTTTFDYDPVTRLLRSVNAPGGRSTHYLHDDFGRVERMIDPRGKVTRYFFNDKDQRTGVAHPDGKTEGFTYKDNGDLLTHTDRGGRLTTFDYDLAGRIKQKMLEETGEPTSIVTLEYNAANQITFEGLSSGGSVERSFDARGRLLAVVQGGSVCEYTYNDDDSISTKKYAGSTLTYTYHPSAHAEAGRLKQVTGLGTLDFTYDAQGRVLTMDLPNGMRRTFGYDDAGRILSMKQESGELVENYLYQYHLCPTEL